jgi:beta-galactosidase/beta-glucuronidase
VSSGYKVWVNGKFLGYAEDSFLPSKFNITPYLQEENVYLFGSFAGATVVFWKTGSMANGKSIVK